MVSDSYSVFTTVFVKLSISTLTQFYLNIFHPGLPSDIQHFLNCGADRVLLKPLDMNAFRQAMREKNENM